MQPKYKYVFYLQYSHSTTDTHINTKPLFAYLNRIANKIKSGSKMRPQQAEGKAIEKLYCRDANSEYHS